MNGVRPTDRAKNARKEELIIILLPGVFTLILICIRMTLKCDR